MMAGTAMGSELEILEKEKLISLLNKYKDSLLFYARTNPYGTTYGVKTQYMYARRIIQKLELELEEDIKKGLIL